MWLSEHMACILVAPCFCPWSWALRVKKTKQGGWSLAGGLKACPISRTMTMNHSRVKPDSKAPKSNTQGRVKAHYQVLLDTPVMSQWGQEPWSLGDLLKRSYSGKEGGGRSQRRLYNWHKYLRGICTAHTEGKNSHPRYQVFITVEQ